MKKISPDRFYEALKVSAITENQRRATATIGLMTSLEIRDWLARVASWIDLEDDESHELVPITEIHLKHAILNYIGYPAMTEYINQQFIEMNRR